MYDTFKLSGKRTLAGQNSGKFFNKHRRGNFSLSIIVKKISQVKRQGRNNPIKFLYCLFLFFKIKYNKVKIKEAPQ